ncbi:ModD protein [Edwardsiella piscicida]|nr:ModD protein [Edwardsiella piscicida]ELM3730023.1 ModD protein [Edwardsiella piscicida]ELV7534877.1 ModD protein [Edwardsiella piscicida]
MIFISDSQLDAWLQEDIQGGDITTRALGIGEQRGEMHFYHRQGGCISAIALTCRMLARLGLESIAAVRDGDRVEPGALLLQARGSAAALHQGWKASQNLLEWSCGVSDYAARMVDILRRYQPEGQIACTRKSIPGTRLAAMQAVLDGGAILHRAGCAETVLLFTNHRRFWPQPDDWRGMVARLRRQAPEKPLIVEADTPQEAAAALAAQPDILQLDKFTPAQIAQIQTQAATLAPRCRLSLAGGINLNSIETIAQTGIGLLITSAPYHAAPADIKVRLMPCP